MKKAVDSFFHHHDTKVQTTPSHSSRTIQETEVIQQVAKDNITRDSSGMIVQKDIATTVEETVIRPAVLEETVREDVVVEVQPVIHRTIERTEIHHIEKHVYEKVLPSGPKVITREPIVELTIQPRIIEEVTTIIHREVPETYVVQEEQHVTEAVVLPTAYTKEIIDDGHITTVASGSLAPIEAVSAVTASYSSTDTTLRQIAEPHERSLVRPYTSDCATSTQKWVAAYPHAMKLKQEGKNSDSDDSHKSDKKQKSSEKAVEEKQKHVEVSPAVNDPSAAHRSASGPSLDHPVFVERTEEHSSLDVRAQLSLERRADLLSGGSDLPGFSGTVHSLQVDRGIDDLERGSQIGLESHSSPISKKSESKTETKSEKKEEKSEKTTKVSTSSPSSSHKKNKLEQDLRKMNAMDNSGKFVLASVKHNAYEQ